MTAVSPRPGSVQPLFALTDEELAVLAGPDQGPVAMPHLEALGDEARTVALHTAYRSMLASGLVTPPKAGTQGMAAGQHGSTIGVELPAQVDAVLVLRDGAPVLLCLQRQLADETLLRYAHLAGDVAVVEDVLPTGLHRFGRVPRAELAACVQQFLVPDDAVTGGRTLTVDPRSGDLPEEVERLLGRTRVNADVTVRRAGDDGPGELLGMFLGAEGSWVSCQRFGAGGPVTFDPLDPASVRERVLRLVTAAERPVDGAGEGGA